MSSKWQIHEAETRLREVVVRALKEGPQTIAEEGQDVAVVISLSEYRQLARPKDDLVDFFRRSPLVGVIELTRDDSKQYRDARL